MRGVPVLEVVRGVQVGHRSLSPARAAVLGEERLEARPDVFLALDQDGLEVVGVEAAEDVEHRALVVARAERLDLAVAEEVADVGELLARRCSAAGLSESKLSPSEQWKA